MLEKLADKGVEQERAVLFPNWVALDEIYPLHDASSFRGMLGLAVKPCVALYSGNMGEKQGLEIVLEAAMMLRECRDIHFVLCGDGAARARLQRQYAGLENVTWLPLQPVEKLNELLNLADVHLLPQRADVADLVMPSRLLGMLASARPVLATVLADTQVGEVVAQCGELSPPGDAHALVQTLQELAGDKLRREKLGAAGRVIVQERFSREAVLQGLERELSELRHA